MKKSIIISIMFVLLLMGTVAASSSIYEKSDNTIKFGNQNMQLESPIFLINDKIYVSLRNLCNELNIPIEWDGENGETTIDIYHKKIEVSNKTEYKEQGVIPDEETALTVGKAILEKYVGKHMEYETEDKIYYLETKYLENENSWYVGQMFSYKDTSKGWSTGGSIYVPCVKISKNTGEVLFINSYSSFKD
jgi:hypothetical protein